MIRHNVAELLRIWSSSHFKQLDYSDKWSGISQWEIVSKDKIKERSKEKDKIIENKNIFRERKREKEEIEEKKGKIWSLCFV